MFDTVFKLRCGASRLTRCGAAVALLLGLFAPGPVAAQVSGIVDIRDDNGRALVRNTSAQPVRVTAALWESDETGERVRLVRAAQANVWPAEFELAPGETQTVRLTLTAGSYAAGTVLRLETRMIPIRAVAQQADAGVNAGFLLATRVLSKVRVHSVFP